jgi:predicted NAD/FAD-dependent oxidoreductase
VGPIGKCRLNAADADYRHFAPAKLAAGRGKPHRPTMERAQPIAVIGAGMAGLACAAALDAAGAPTRLFDKGRRAGGRLATRRVGEMAFNHGAQYATAHSDGFRALLQEMHGAGDAGHWPQAGSGRWSGLPGMSGIGRHLERRLPAPVQTGRHVGFLHHDGAAWRVRHVAAEAARPGSIVTEGGELSEPFAAVILALPAPQAAVLLRTARHDFAERADAVLIAPCWALMLAFDTLHSTADIIMPDQGALRWIARDSSRPGRAALPECWVAHATPEWSREHLELSAEAAATVLQAEFAAATGINTAPRHLAAHRWRHSLTEQPLGEPCLWDGMAGIGVCGDWCLGARVEAAWTSGHVLGVAIAGSLGSRGTGEGLAAR